MPVEEDQCGAIIHTDRELANILDRHRDEIASAWVDKLRGIQGLHFTQEAHDEMLSWASSAISHFIRTLETDSCNSIDTLADEVSRIRLQRDLRMSEVVQALVLLNEVVVPYVLKAYPTDPLLASEAITRLFTCIRLVAARYIDLHGEYIGNPLQLTENLLERQDLPAVLRIVCAEAQQLTGAGGSAVLLLDENERFKVALGLDDASVRPDFIFRAVWPESGPLLPDEPLLLNDLQIDGCTPAIEKEINSLLIAPLRVRSNAVGILLLVNSTGGFKEYDIRVIGMFADWAAVALGYARLSQQHEQLAVLDERQKLARDLHDSVTQSIYAVTLYAEASVRLLSESKVSKAIENLAEIRDTALAALREMRLLVFELRPHFLEEEGLVPTLQARLAAVEERVGILTTFECEGIGLLPDKLEEGFYGIAIEALNNALKHSNADRISVSLRQSGSDVVLEIEDNGRGFDLDTGKKKGGLGLRGMEERAAQLNGRLLVTARQGHGTSVRVEVLLNGEK